MTEAELIQIPINTKKTAELIDKYETLLNQSKTKGQIITDMPTSHNRSDAIGNYVVDKARMLEEVEQLNLGNILLIKKARSFIESIPDSNIRMILELKYINHLWSSDIIGCIGEDEISKEKDLDLILEMLFMDLVLW